MGEKGGRGIIVVIIFIGFCQGRCCRNDASSLTEEGRSHWTRLWWDCTRGVWGEGTGGRRGRLRGGDTRGERGRGGEGMQCLWRCRADFHWGARNLPRACRVGIFIYGLLIMNYQNYWDRLKLRDSILVFIRFFKRNVEVIGNLLTVQCSIN